MTGEKLASPGWDELVDCRTQFKNPASAAPIGVHFLLGKVVKIPADDGCHLLVEQVEKFSRNLLKLSGTHGEALT
jgi:hypothetical protein